MSLLPPLPSPNQRTSATHQNDYGFSKEQMQAYGQACREEALEEAAAVLESDIYTPTTKAYREQYNAGVALRVSKIRNLK